MKRSEDSNQSPQPNSRQLSHPSRWELQRNNLNTVIRKISTRVRTNGLLHVRHKVGRRRVAADLGHLDIKVWHQSELRVFPIRYDSIWRRHRLKLLLLQSLYKRTCLIRAIHIHCSVVLTWYRKAKMNTISSAQRFHSQNFVFLHLFHGNCQQKLAIMIQGTSPYVLWASFETLVKMLKWGVSDRASL